MTDFYSELELDRSLTAAQLLDKLNQLERVWVQRQVTKPEKATEKLALIYKAREAFATEQKRAAYDRELEQSRQKPVEADPQAERRAQFEKWYRDALSYDQNGENDLARTAMEKAMGYWDTDEEDPSVYDAVSGIYRKNKDYQAAVNYANKAILADPTNPYYYLTKALAYSWNYAELSRDRYKNREALYVISADGRAALQSALSKAEARNDQLNSARALGLLAFSYYYEIPADAAAAEKYAQDASRMGDDWGNSARVLDAISAAREDAQKRKEEAEENERIRREEAEKAVREYKEKEAKKKAKERASLMLYLLYLLSWVCVAGSIAFFVKTVLDGSLGNAVPIALMTVIVYGSVAFLNFIDIFVNGECGFLTNLVTGAYAFVYIFMTATTRYTQMGYSAASAGETWKFVGVMVAVYVVMIIAVRVIAGKASKNS